MKILPLKLYFTLMGLVTTLFIGWIIANKFFIHNKNAVMVSLNQPETYQLGNYFELQKTYSLVIKKNYGQDISDKSLNTDIFNKFWQRVISRDNRYNFWLDNQYFKQRMSGDNTKDLAQLNDLIDKFHFSENNHSIHLILDNTNQALNLIREYIIYTNNAVKNDIYSDIVARWKLNFTMLQSLTDSGNKQAQEYLNLIKNVNKLDDKLQSYSFSTSPIVQKYNNIDTLEYSKLVYFGKMIYIFIFLWLTIFLLLSVIKNCKITKKKELED